MSLKKVLNDFLVMQITVTKLYACMEKTVLFDGPVDLEQA